MMGLGLQEMLFILGAALLLFGPRKLPEIGRTLGKGLAEFRRASTELKRSLDTEVIEEELRESKKAFDEVDPRRVLGSVGRGDKVAPVTEPAGDIEPAEPAADVETSEAAEAPEPSEATEAPEPAPAAEPATATADRSGDR